MTAIALFLTAPHPCSYLDEESAQSVFVDPALPLTPTIYAELLSLGFRRSGDQVYRPYCQACQACIPIRLPVATFSPNRRQKRCWQKNSQTLAVIKPPVFDDAHYQLYLRYQQARHAGGEMADSTPEDYLGFLGNSWGKTLFVEFFIDKQLAGLAVIDQTDNALSAVYTFFDPAFADYSLGTYAVLWQIELARQQQQAFVYLGFWIAECKKMAYKNQYKPMQLFIDNQWLDSQD
jgi:arginyl-tRNA--protein-N-Asp/Glu arginylyltransferase